MGLFQRLRNAFGRRSVSQVSLMSEQGNSYYMWRGSVYQSDIVRSCMRPKVKQIGKLVGRHLRETINEDGTRTLAVNPSFNIRMLLEEPNPLMTGQMLQEKLAAQLILNNNAFAFINRNEDGIPVEIYPINAQGVEAEYVNDRCYLKFTMANGKVFTFAYTDIIHIRNDFNENDVFGTSLAPALVPLLDVVTITDQGLVNAIKNSSVVRWLLKFTNSIRPDDLKRQAKEFADNYLETSSGLGVAAVDSKADAKQVNPTDYVPNASVMSRTQERIYALFNVSHNIVNSCASEDERNAYFDAEIEPVLLQLSAEYTRKIFSRRQRGFGNSIVFEASAWDAASFQTKLNLVQLVDRGALTPNEWRAAFNLAPIPGGDTPIRRLDTAAVEDTRNNGEGGGSE